LDCKINVHASGQEGAGHAEPKKLEGKTADTALDKIRDLLGQYFHVELLPPPPSDKECWFVELPAQFTAEQSFSVKLCSKSDFDLSFVKVVLTPQNGQVVELSPSSPKGKLVAEVGQTFAMRIFEFNMPKNPGYFNVKIEVGQKTMAKPVTASVIVQPTDDDPADDPRMDGHRKIELVSSVDATIRLLTKLLDQYAVNNMLKIMCDHSPICVCTADPN